ncbi:hypothetical protein Dimus_037603, partial [Dionaea muscipula]
MDKRASVTARAFWPRDSAGRARSGLKRRCREVGRKRRRPNSRYGRKHVPYDRSRAVVLLAVGMSTAVAGKHAEQDAVGSGRQQWSARQGRPAGGGLAWFRKASGKRKRGRKSLREKVTVGIY